MPRGKLELRVPQDRAGRFSTERLERYLRSEEALVAVLAEIFVHGCRPARARRDHRATCGHSFSATAISAIDATLDEACQYLILDAYKRVHEAGVVCSQDSARGDWGPGCTSIRPRRGAGSFAASPSSTEV